MEFPSCPWSQSLQPSPPSYVLDDESRCPNLSSKLQCTDAEQSEAIRAYNQQLDGNRAALKPEFARAPSPFAANQFTEAAFEATIKSIENNASAQTRPLYNRGRMSNGSNWVIRWMLYHVCRYRDGRNKQKAQSQKFHDDDNLDDGGSGIYSHHMRY